MFAVVAVAIGALIAAASADSPSPQQLTAFNQGQAYQRLFQDHVMPGTCGIVLERPRCIADFEAVRAMRGPDPTDAAMQTWLASGDLSLAVKDWNGIYVPEKAWAASPAFAWWYTAGEVSIAASLPVNAGTTQYVSQIPDLLIAHNSAIPPNFQGLVPANGTPFDRLRPLQDALSKVFPTSPYPDPSLVDGVRGDAQLGVYASTLQELVDNPLALSRPESRAFGLIVVNRLQAIDDAYKTGASLAVVSAALVGNIPDEPNIEPLRDALSKSISTTWPSSRRQAYIMGALTAQVAYNAAVLRDPRWDTGFRNALFSLPPYDGMSAQVHADLLALKAIPAIGNGGAWDAINAAASKATDDMAASP
jgi:hypothetical protein